MPAADPRYGVAQVSEEARDGWRAFCDRHDIDRTAFAEVLGLELGRMTGPPPPVIQRAVNAARDLKNQRRRRG